MARQTRRVQIRLGAVVGSMLLLLMTAFTGPVVAQDGTGQVTVTLNQVDASNVSGTAVLTPYGNQTTVDMTLTGAGILGNHPTHIHTGTCSNFDPNPLIPLETVVLEPLDQTGKSVTTVDAALDQLESGDYVILIHKSPEELTNYLACGEIPRVAGLDAGPVTVPADHATHGGAMSAATPGVTTMPISGAGVTAEIGHGGTMTIALGALAGVSLLVGLYALRRRWN
jgi:hypothetical protein